jgi:hypothetical protein
VNTNDIKAGTNIILANGFNATMKDNKRGNIRVCEVEGYHTELGSVYAHDIVKAYDPVKEEYVKVIHTPAQLKCKSLNAALWG